VLITDLIENYYKTWAKLYKDFVKKNA